MPIPPIPAQPSRKTEPSTLAPRILKIVSLSLSLVGRMPAGGVALRRRLLYRPEIIRISMAGDFGLRIANFGLSSIQSQVPLPLGEGPWRLAILLIADDAVPAAERLKNVAPSASRGYACRGTATPGS